jgi:hypothetical protein
MATTTIIREDENSAVVRITGSIVETGSIVVNPSSFTNLSGTGILSIEKIDWAITGTNRISLLFHGSVNNLIGTFAGNGRLNLYKDYQAKITNSNSGTNGNVLITTTTTDPYVIIIRLEKTSGFLKVGQYS